MKLKKYLPIIGLGIFIYILIKLDIKNIIHELGNINYLFVLSFFMIPLFLLTQTLKWFVIAKRQNIKLPFKTAYVINLKSNFYGFITPSKIGAIIRADYLKKYSGSLAKGTSNFVLDKVLDVSSVFFLAILFSIIFQDVLDLKIGVLILIFSLTLVITWFFINKERSKIPLRFIYRKLIPNKNKDKFKSAFNGFYEDMPKKRYFILFFILNIINWITIYFTTYLIAMSLGIDLNFIHFLAILPIGTIVGLIPISINGLGTREATFIKLFGLFNIEAAKVFTMSLLSLFVTGILPAGIMALWILFKKK